MVGKVRNVLFTHYTKKDWVIFFVCMPPFTIIVNFFLFGREYFTDIKIFLFSGIIIFFIESISWYSLTWIAVTLRNRFPKDVEIVKRLCIAIPLFTIITWLTITAIFLAYDRLHIFGYRMNEKNYQWLLGICVIINIFITLLHEGVSGFEKWRITLTQTEQLKKEYMQSQLLGLKSQVNPHFLFNSLNSLSCLIQENPANAEKFLDEMSKVYRYLLRNSDEHLVSLATELQFVYSYFYLLKARYGEGIELSIKVDEESKHKFIPPLTLQILLESTVNNNAISKEHPLKLMISVTENGWLEIKNNIQKKISDEVIDNTGLENVCKKFRLLCNESVLVSDRGTYLVIRLPLIPSLETNVA